MDGAEAGSALAHPGSPRTEAELAAELELARARFQASLSALNTRLDELRDWRAWVRRHPLPFILGAAALGALAGWRRFRRRH